MRKVKYQYYSGNGQWVDAEGWFHQWGSGVLEANEGPPVQFTQGIIEDEVTGKVCECEPSRIQFLTPYKQ